MGVHGDAEVKRAGIGILAAVAVAGMLTGGGIALRPYLFRETVTLRSELSDGPGTDAFSRGVRIALEEHGYQAGVFRVRHENVSMSPLLLGRTFEPTPSPSVLFPQRRTYLAPLHPAGRWRAENDPGYFRRATSDPREGELAARWAQEAGVQNAYVLAVPFDPVVEISRYSPSYWHGNIGGFGPYPVSGFLRAGRKGGLQMVGTEPVPDGDFEYRHLVARVARWKTDMVYIDAEGQGARLARDLRTKGYRGRLLLSSRSVGDDFFAVAGNAANGVVTSWAVESPPPDDFDRRHRARFGTAADPHAYDGYEEAVRLLRAIGRRDVRNAADLERAFDPRLDPIVEPSKFALYAGREGRFDFVEVLP